MTIELIAFLGSVFIVTVLVAKLHERRQDVLHGPYIQGREAQDPFKAAIDRLERAIEFSGLRQGFARLGWKVRNVSCFAAAIIC